MEIVVDECSLGARADNHTGIVGVEQARICKASADGGLAAREIFRVTIVRKASGSCRGVNVFCQLGRVLIEASPNWRTGL